MLIRKLAVQENTFKDFSGKVNSRNERENHREGEKNLEKMNHKTFETLRM